jgi:hypothetical protein
VIDHDEAQGTSSQPLIGRLVHAAVQLAGIVGPAWLGWQLAGGGIAGAGAAVALGVAFAILWFGVYAPADPEWNHFGILPVSGRLRLVLEIVLIIAGGCALWMVWHRAAGETFMTVAFIDLVIRYPRLFALYRSRGSSAEHARHSEP